MDWTRALDGYCERLGPGLWAEPWNLVTNLAFILAGIVMYVRCRGLVTGMVLAWLEVLIGIGSGLFHSFANVWSELADVIPIQIFILAYLYVVNRDFAGMNRWLAIVPVLAFFPFAYLTVPLFMQLDWLGSSAAYGPVPVLLLAYALLFARHPPGVARGLVIGAGILIVSLAFRTIDMPLCERWPTGTHFVWHSLNAVMLAWMIETWRRHRLAGMARTG